MEEKRLRKLAGLKLLNEDLSSDRTNIEDSLDSLSKATRGAISFAGGAFDPDSDSFNRNKVKKAQQALSKIKSKIKEIEKLVSQLSRMG